MGYPNILFRQRAIRDTWYSENELKEERLPTVQIMRAKAILDILDRIRLKAPFNEFSVRRQLDELDKARLAEVYLGWHPEYRAVKIVGTKPLNPKKRSK